MAKRGKKGRSYKTSPAVEYKFHDRVNTDAVVSLTGDILTSVVLIAQGTGESQRVGRKLVITSISMRWLIGLNEVTNAGDVPEGDICRIIVFMDRQSNGAEAAVLDILETAAVLSYRNLSKTGRFQILYDKIHTLNRMVAVTDGTNTSTTPETERYLTWHKKCRIPVEFNDVNGVISELTTNNISSLYISQHAKCGVHEQQTRVRFIG